MKRPVSDRHQAEGGDVDDVFYSIICHRVVAYSLSEVDHASGGEAVTRISA